MKIREMIQIVRPTYTYLRLKPNNSIKNNATHKLARAIGMLYLNVLDMVKKEEEKAVKLFGREFIMPTKISIHTPSKVGYFLYIEKGKVEFYFIIPQQHAPFLREKMGDVWSNVTIEEVEELPSFGETAAKYQLTYRKEDGLSLQSDRRNNDLLHSNLNVVEMMEEGDKVGVFYNFIPISQHGWRYQHRAAVDKVRNNRPVERNKAGAAYLLKSALGIIDSLMTTFGEAFSGRNRKNRESLISNLIERMNGGASVSNDTTAKGNGHIIGAQIIVLSESEDVVRKRNSARSLTQSFDTISGDNELVAVPLRKSKPFTSYSISSDRIKIGDEEAQNFIALAGRDVLERFNFIERIETHETEVPEDLRDGVMCIGSNRYRGNEQKAYLSNDREYRNLLTLLIGPTRAGKSNLIANLSIDAIEAGECVIIFDFIENCELSDEVANCFTRDKVLEIRCDDFNHLQGLGYNEVGASKDVFKQYENAKRQTANLLTLVNAINSDESRLSPKMERYLESASLIVFISNGSIKDVFAVLQNHRKRKEYIDKVPKTQYNNLGEYMENLSELDEEDKKGEVCGTKTNLITGIIDRLNVLKRNTYMELMLKKDTATNIDLSKEMQKNQLIVIKMPQHMFTTDGEKDICTTYWITKIWLALQVRADRIRDKTNRTKVNLVIDELYQVDNTEKFLTNKLSQIAKFIMKPIISCHYINQLKHMRDELRSANTSYMLISGCDKKNFDELKNELYPFTDEDLRNLPRYHSLNYIKSKDGYARFISRLPGKVGKRIVATNK